VGVGVGSALPTGVGVRDVVGIADFGAVGGGFAAVFTFDGGAVGGLRGGSDMVPW